MNKHAGKLRNDSRAWVEVPADDNGDAMIAAMAEAGVEYIFFTSGSEIGFYQEAVAKAHAHGRKAPKLITVTHEHASLNAALGYAAVTGKPAVTAAHVDCGTQHYGGAVHTAFHSGLPVVITGGGSPTSYPGSFTARATAAATSGCSRASTRTPSCGSTPSGTTAWRSRTIRA